MLAEQTIHTTVHHQLLRKKLMRGSLFASIGGCIILFFGMFASVNVLDKWGMLTILTGFMLIAWGLIPYRKLNRLLSSPNSLKINIEGLSYVDRSREMFFIPLKSIECIHFIDRKDRYGIAVHLKNKLSQKVQILDPRFKPKSFLFYSKQVGGADLYLPYFSKRAYNELLGILKETE
jgi:hypothetical protein